MISTPNMKPEEKVASDFLKVRFSKEPNYEPLGRGTAPDFSIDGTAFEVRRLNQNFIQNGTAQGLEEVSLPLEKSVYCELGKIPFSSQLGSFFWGLRFERPLSARIRKIGRELVSGARSHYLSGLRTRELVSAYDVELELIPAVNSYGKAFVFAYGSDGDSGGWFGEIYSDNIRLALEDKIRKTESVSSRFGRWILVLIDSIIRDASWVNEVGALSLDLRHFNGIVVLNPDGSLAMEWPLGSLE